MRGLLLTASLVAIFSTPLLAQQVLQKEPPAGQLSVGKVVLVDDGTCPRGQIKEVTGGSNIGQNARGGQRTRRCIPRP